jgi:hypothetical protein
LILQSGGLEGSGPLIHSTNSWVSVNKLRCSKFMFLHKQVAKARAADSAINTE